MTQRVTMDTALLDRLRRRDGGWQLGMAIVVDGSGGSGSVNFSQEAAGWGSRGGGCHGT
jgi:hypothetical protein